MKGAITQAGINRQLPFRRLAIVRDRSIPGGKETASLSRKFEDLGGVYVKPSLEDLKAIDALYRLSQASAPDFHVWLKSRRPTSGLALIQAVAPIPDFARASTRTEAARPAEESRVVATERPVQAESPAPLADTGEAQRETDRFVSTGETPFPLGRLSVAGRPGEPVTMPLGLLEKHTVVLAGAGSGKTVLLRRMVEEAVLLGIPSIVIDFANDLATLGDAWPSPPDGWEEDDHEKAGRYEASREVVIWTPGRDRGNPLTLEPLPDLSPFAGDADGLESAVAMAVESLAPIVAPGRTASSKNKLGILSEALRFFAGQGVGTLEGFVGLLDDLPPQAACWG